MNVLKDVCVCFLFLIFMPFDWDLMFNVEKQKPSPTGST